MPGFDPTIPLIGGVLVGLSATAMLLLLGRVAGISGIVGGLLLSTEEPRAWRAAFVAGLVVGGWILVRLIPNAFAMEVDRSAASLIAAGLLVGFGTRLGGGCTSGHGVCGIARGSRRSFVATLVFMATGAVTAFAITQWAGGRL